MLNHCVAVQSWLLFPFRVTYDSSLENSRTVIRAGKNAIHRPNRSLFVIPSHARRACPSPRALRGLLGIQDQDPIRHGLRYEPAAALRGLRDALVIGRNDRAAGRALSSLSNFWNLDAFNAAAKSI